MHMAEEKTEDAEPWPAISDGTSVSGLVGGALVLALSGMVGMVLRGRHRPQSTR